MAKGKGDTAGDTKSAKLRTLIEMQNAKFETQARSEASVAQNAGILVSASAVSSFLQAAGDASVWSIAALLAAVSAAAAGITCLRSQKTVTRDLSKFYPHADDKGFSESDFLNVVYKVGEQVFNERETALGKGKKIAAFGFGCLLFSMLLSVMWVIDSNI